MSPLANSYVKAPELNEMERFYPLHVYICESCFLVQLVPVAKPEDVFSEYSYFSSYSDSWLEHARVYTDSVTQRFGLNSTCRVVEIASNDGYLLEYTVDRSPHKQGHFLPGTHIPIYHPDKIKQTRPDYVVILPWNLKHEIMEQMAYVREWGARFIVPIPKIQVL
jgi:hypothetical protein